MLQTSNRIVNENQFVVVQSQALKGCEISLQMQKYK